MLLYGFPGSSDSKESACNSGDLGLNPESGRSPEGRCGNSFQYFWLENPHGQRSLTGYSPLVAESDMTDQLSSQTHTSCYQGQKQINHKQWYLTVMQEGFSYFIVETTNYQRCILMKLFFYSFLKTTQQHRNLSQ